MAYAVIDESELLSRLEGDEELLAELIDTFLEESGPLLQQVADAAGSRDAAALNRAAHTLKGMVSVFGNLEAAHTARALEAMGRKGDLEKAREATANLQEQMEALEKSLAALKEKHGPSSDRG